MLEAKTPMQDKLPKDSIYYKHFMNQMFTTKLTDAVQKQVDDDRTMMKDIKNEIKK